MNICMLVGTDMSHDARVWKEAITLADAGHAVTVLAAFNDALPAEESAGGVRVIRVEPRALRPRRAPKKALDTTVVRTEPSTGQAGRAGFGRNFRDWVWGVRARIEVLAWIWRLKPDILHVHDADRLLLGGLAHSLFGCQFIYDAHEYVAGLLIKDGRRARLMRRWHVSLERWLAPRARRVIAVNKPIGELLKTRYHLNDVVLLHNFPAPQPAVPTRHLLRSLLPTELQSRPLLLYQGRLTAHRGIEQFIEALARVEGAVGAIVGSGPLEHDLIALAAKLGVSSRLILVPQVPWNQLAAYTAGADLGFCLSQATCENNRLALPNKLFEYLMAGVPVVVSDYPILRQYVVGETVGAVVAPDSPENIAKVVAGLLGRPDQLLEMRRNALRVSSMKYNWETEATKLVTLYEQLEQPEQAPRALQRGERLRRFMKQVCAEDRQLPRAQAEELLARRREAPTDESSAARFYDERYAEGYMEEWPTWKKRRVASLIRQLNLPPTGRALDFGCGQGVFTEVLREALPGWTISGTDLSTAAINAARSRFPGCTFFHLPAGAPDSSVAPFDLLFTHHVLEHVLNIERTWEVMASFLKTGGAMLHVLPCGDDDTLERRICSMRFDGIDRRRGNRFFYEDEGHVRRFHSAELQAAAKRYGFEPGARRFANAYWGAIEWITEAGPDWVRTLTDATEARDAASKGALRRLRFALLALSIARMPTAKLAGVAKEPASSRRSAKLVAGVAGYPLAWALDRFLRLQSEREWQSAKTGSEMYLSFSSGRLNQ